MQRLGSAAYTITDGSICVDTKVTEKHVHVMGTENIKNFTKILVRYRAIFYIYFH